MLGSSLRSLTQPTTESTSFGVCCCFYGFFKVIKICLNIKNKKTKTRFMGNRQSQEPVREQSTKEKLYNYMVDMSRLPHLLVWKITNAAFSDSLLVLTITHKLILRLLSVYQLSSCQNVFIGHPAKTLVTPWIPAKAFRRDIKKC